MIGLATLSVGEMVSWDPNVFSIVAVTIAKTKQLLFVLQEQLPQASNKNNNHKQQATSPATLRSGCFQLSKNILIFA